MLKTARKPLRKAEELIKAKLSILLENKKNLIIGCVCLLVILLWGIAEYFYSWESTDDAYVQAPIHNIAPRVSGVVQEVYISDNQFVKAGEALFMLDQKDFGIALRAKTSEAYKAEREYNRLLQLTKNFVSALDIDSAKAEFDKAQAELDQAIANLEYTIVKSPVDGRVGRKNVELGDVLSNGQVAVAIVEPTPWIVANYKEIQFGRLKVGQKVSITIDSFPDREFKGVIDGFSPGTGSQFTLIPPDNATGNFTKVVQRVPTKIIFEPQSIAGIEDKIIPGLSVVTSIKVN